MNMNSNISKTKNILLSLLVILISITSNYYSQSYNGYSCNYYYEPEFSALSSGINATINQTTNLPVGNYAMLSSLIIFAYFFVLTALYMLYHFFIRNAEFELFVKSEFLHLAASVVILLSVIFLVESVITILSAYAPYNPYVLVSTTGTNTNRLTLACYAAANIDYSIYKLNQYYNQLVREVFIGERELSRCFSIFGYQFCPGLMDWLKIKGYYSLFQQVMRAQMLGDMIVNLQLALSIQLQLLTLIDKNALSLLLPLGILLRVLPITRGIGGLMIASAIGFYFIFPLVYYVALQIPAGEIIERTTIPAQVCYPSFSGAISLYESYLSSYSVTFSVIDVALDFIAQLRIFEWIIPFIALSITAIFIRYVSSLLGSDSSELFSMIYKIT